MAARMWKSVLEQIHSLAASPLNAQMGDAELLSRFVAQHDEAAFEALLRRHGSMVLRVARRVLSSEPDAEDVFQATFLLLARRAGVIRKRESVASWLHGVAHRLALSARGKRARRQECERHAAARSIDSAPESSWSELEETLHAVLAQLPAKYRTPLVYCYLEGWTQEEVARQLGKPLGTVRSWLARGRELLRKRLLRRGISLSAEGASTALLASACATAEAVPISMRIATFQAARLFAAGGNVMTLVSPPVAALVRRGMTALFIAKLKGGAVCLLALALLIAGTGWGAHRTFGAKSPEQNEAAEKAPPKQAAPEARPRTDAHGDPLPPGATARLGTVRFRHEGWLKESIVSPDGRTIAATAGRSVAFWDIATARMVRRWTFPREDVHCLAFAPDGKSVAVGGEACVVHLFDLASGKETQRFVGHRANKEQPGFTIFGLAFSPDGRRVISWASDKTVRVWETHSGKELRQMGGEDWWPWELSPDGKLLAMRKGTEKMLRLWDMTANREFRQLSLPGELGAVAFSPDGQTLALSANEDGQPARIVLWDIASGKELGTLTGHKDWVLALAFTPDGKRLASAGQDRTIRLWDLGARKEIQKTLSAHTPVHRLSFSPDGKILISHGAENHVRLWDMASWCERLSAGGPGMSIWSVAYSPDGELLASLSGNEIWLWSLTTGELVRKLEGHRGPVSAVMFSSDGRLLASGSQDSTLRVWDRRTGKERNRILAASGFDHAALSPDGKILAAWGVGNPQEIHLWHTTGDKLPTLKVPSEQPGVRAALSTLCFSRDGKALYAASGTHTSILCWDVATGKVLPPLGKHDGGLNGIALSADGRSLAALTANGTLYLWETATGQARLVVKTAGYATSVAFSPDGQLLALANTGNHSLWGGKGDEVFPRIENREQVRLLRVADGRIVHRFIGHIGGISSVCFSPDGRTLASGGLDTTVLLWDVRDRAVPRGKETPHLTTEKLGELWKGLGGTAAESHSCMSTLIPAPGQTVPFLGEKLKPVLTVDAERFARLLNKLESDQFDHREEAMRELKKLGDSIEPALCKALREKPPLETRRRLQALLDELAGDERLRALRAIEVLERIGDKPARDLLQKLSAGAAGAWLTDEARATLQRLQRREKTIPTKPH